MDTKRQLDNTKFNDFNNRLSFRELKDKYYFTHPEDFH